jgi:hypothetical protein
MEENKPAEVAAEVVTAPAAVEAAPEKPKRKRSPRKPAAAAAPEASVKRERKPKETHEVVQDGRNIFVRGSFLTVAKLTPTQRKNFGIKDVDGRLGTPCSDEVVLTFKSPKAAEEFFDGCFNCDEGYEGLIKGNSKVRWYGDAFNKMF